LSEYRMKIEYKKGKEIANVDALSGIEIKDEETRPQERRRST
jgi:hypothetical protein